MELKKSPFKKLALLIPLLLVIFSFKPISSGLYSIHEGPWVAPKWADTLTNSNLSNPKFIKSGKGIYHSHCIVCHGDKGRGDGVSGFGLSVTPGDLNDLVTVNESDGAIFWKITNGKRPMMEYKFSLNDEERWQLVAYIRDLQNESKEKIEKRKYKMK